MRKLLSLFMQAVLVSNLSFFVLSCYNPLAGSNRSDKDTIVPPVPPIVKDIKYYQLLIKKTKIYLDNCKELIETIKENWKNDKDGNISDEDYQLMIDQISAELYIYQSEINEYQYQILLLEKKDNEFTFKQISQGINITTEKINNLKQALKLQEKYPDNYPELKLKHIKSAINQTIEIREMFLRLIEERNKINVTINFIANITVRR